MENVETALELFSNEFNCAQAVLVAFADKLGLDEKQQSEFHLHLAAVLRVMENYAALFPAL